MKPPINPNCRVSGRFRAGANFLKLAAIFTISVSASTLAWGNPVFTEDFQSGLTHWNALSETHAQVIQEPGTDNRVLELTPRPRDFSHVILKPSLPSGPLRMEGRFLFPTDGDGYLGLIYNHQQTDARTDFGVVYVKSNGNYVRVSPHYDGNPSWRLYEEMKVPLEGAQSVQVGRWTDFRLDVHGRWAALYLVNMETPVVVFDESPHDSGTWGLEARPGGGEPVWLDDIRISRLSSAHESDPPPQAVSELGHWQYQPAIPDPQDFTLTTPELASDAWIDLATDRRGAVITGLLTQYESGDRSVVYLRSRFSARPGHETAWLALSSANRIDVWMDGYYRGTVAPERYIWSDHVLAPEHLGARLPLLTSPGIHELVFRVYGDRFAGGGFFADVVYPQESE